MIKRLFKLIIRIIVIIFIIGIVTGLIDLVRVNNNKLPIFNISNYDTKSNVQSFRGIVYSFSRKIKANINEDIIDSSKVKFKLLGINMKVNKEYPTDTYEYNITYNKGDCESKLYYADYEIKVYTYCLDNVKINNKSFLSILKTNKKFMNNIVNGMIYKGTSLDNIMMYTDNNISLFQCDNDIYYIGLSDMKVQDDFCIPKDDDFKFLFKISEELPEGIVLEAKDEVFYEDEKYLYQFNQVKSNYIYIIVEPVRGFPMKKYSLKDVLNTKMLTIDELDKEGLKFEKIDKSKIEKES